MSKSRIFVLLLAVAVTGYPAVHAGSQPPQAARGGDLVPINVRVIDRSGKLITGLAQSDFTVLEDGVPQRIQQFSPQAITAGAPSPATKLALRTRISTSPQVQRLFVFALGLGRLEGVPGGVSALIRFVKTQLLPQDQVAIFAYDRAITFTSDHARILEALERIKKSHEDISFKISQELGPMGLAGLYGSRALPKKLQARIDEMLLGPGAAPPAPITVDQIDTAAFGELSLDTFMASSAMSLQDLDNMMTLMEYLRRFEGEKHVLFLTEQGFLWPTEANDESIAAAANDARASIHTLQTGSQLSATATREVDATMQQSQSFQSLRRISDLTGGISSIMGSGQALLDKVDESSRSGYLLEYQPSDSAWDARYRRIEVKVNRPDVTVLHRHGYYRIAEAGPFDRRAFITQTRLGAAASTQRSLTDIKVRASLSLRGNDTMEVKGTIEIKRIKLATIDGSHVGRLNVAAFGLDSGNNFKGLRTETLRAEVDRRGVRARAEGGVRLHPSAAPDSERAAHPIHRLRLRVRPARADRFESRRGAVSRKLEG